MREFIVSYENVEYPGMMEKAKNPAAALLLLHGVGEHCTRFSRIFQFLAERGVSAYAFDLPGHGLSPGVRGHIGQRTDFFCLTDEALALVSAENPGVPLFLMGHSMGGNLALSYRLFRMEAKLAGYVISSPWLVLKDPPRGLRAALLPLLARISPESVSKTGIPPEALYTPSEEIPPEKSPLMHPLISAKTARDNFRWAESILEKADVERPPVYLFHGSADSVCLPEGSRMFAKKAGPLCLYREWEGLKHETLNEKRWRTVAEDMCGWVLKRAAVT